MLNNRYERNLGTLGVDGQKKLADSRVAVIGCGGLGGWIIELLARSGVGEIVVVDGDVFSESNLNRQLLATEHNLGQNKAIAAAERVRLINSSVVTFPVQIFLDERNALDILKNCDIAFDALDSLSARVILCRAAANFGIKVIHGAIAGWWGQAAVIEPENSALVEMWAAHAGEKGVETQTGNPAFTPSLVASIQVAEGIKCLLGKQTLPANTLLYIDLLEHRFERIGV